MSDVEETWGEGNDALPGKEAEGPNPPGGGAEGANHPAAAEAGAAGLVSLLEPGDFWTARSVRPGCILDVPVAQEEEGVQQPGCIILFVQEVKYLMPGCWVKVRFLGGEPAWARAEGIKVFSRERRDLHLCCGGVDACSETEGKAYHVELFGVYPPGHPPPECVEKAKRREWAKLYQELSRQGAPPGAEGAGAPQGGPREGDAVDRISALRKRLQAGRPLAAAEESGEIAARGANRVRFAPAPLAIEPRSAVKSEARARAVIAIPSDSDGEPPRSRKKRTSMGEALAEAVALRAQGGGGGAASSSRQRSRSREPKKKKKRRSGSRRRRDSRSSSSDGATSSSSSLVPPLQRKANKDPGSVLRMLLTNVAEALAEAAVDTPGDSGQLQGKANQLSSYFQICAKPLLGGKVRDLRELETLARCIDHLKCGRLAELGDALAGRFLAVESAAITNNWQDAQHLEVVPIRHAGLAPPAVMLQAQRHTRQVEKSLGKNQWRRTTPYAPPNREGGGGEKGGGGKGKGDRRGQGKGKFGKNSNKNAWKETPKDKPAEGGGGGGAPK